MASPYKRCLTDISTTPLLAPRLHTARVCLNAYKPGNFMNATNTSIAFKFSASGAGTAASSDIETSHCDRY